MDHRHTLILIISLSLIIISKAYADEESSGAEETPTTSSNLTDEQKKKKEELNYQAEIAELEKKIRDANKPSSTLVPREGTISATETKFAGTTLAYKQLDDIAKKIVTSKANELKSPVTITTKTTFVDQLNAYQIALSQIEELTNTYSTISAALNDDDLDSSSSNFTELTSKVDNLTGTLGAVTSLLAIFRVDREQKGFEVSLDSHAVAAAFAKQIQKLNKKVRYLDLAVNPTGSSEILGELDDLTSFKIKANNNAKKKKKESDKLDGETQKLIAELDKLNTKTETFLNSLNGTGDVEKSNKSKLLEAEAFLGSSSEGSLLIVRPVAGGGATQTKRNILWTSISHSGGAVINYWIMGTKGEILSAGNGIGNSGFLSGKKIKESLLEEEPTSTPQDNDE